MTLKTKLTILYVLFYGNIISAVSQLAMYLVVGDIDHIFIGLFNITFARMIDTVIQIMKKRNAGG